MRGRKTVLLLLGRTSAFAASGFDDMVVVVFRTRRWFVTCRCSNSFRSIAGMSRRSTVAYQPVSFAAAAVVSAAFFVAATFAAAALASCRWAETKHVHWGCWVGSCGILRRNLTGLGLDLW